MVERAQIGWAGAQAIGASHAELRLRADARAAMAGLRGDVERAEKQNRAFPEYILRDGELSQQNQANERAKPQEDG
jgi:hypothetical protein